MCGDCGHNRYHISNQLCLLFFIECKIVLFLSSHLSLCCSKRSSIRKQCFQAVEFPFLAWLLTLDSLAFVIWFAEARRRVIVSGLAKLFPPFWWRNCCAKYLVVDWLSCTHLHCTPCCKLWGSPSYY